MISFDMHVHRISTVGIRDPLKHEHTKNNSGTTPPPFEDRTPV
jgi:hypothetical protein